MANVTSLYELTEGLQGGLSIEGRDGGRYTRVFQVEFDDYNPNVWAALEAENPNDPLPDDEASRIPSYGDAHPEDPTSLAFDKNATPAGDDPWTWIVTVQYKFPTIDQNAGGSPPAPTDQQNGQDSGNKPEPLPSHKVTRGTWSRTKAWEKDTNDLLVKNSAGDPFDPPLTTELTLSTWTFTRSQTSFSDDWKECFQGCTNLFEFTIGDKEYAADTLKVSSITAEEVPATEHTPRYYTVSITIQHEPLGWNPAPLDRGTRELVGGVLKPIFDKLSATPVTTPRLLDGTGGKLADGGTPVYLNGQAPSTFGPFILHNSYNFDWLALDAEDH